MLGFSAPAMPSRALLEGVDLLNLSFLNILLNFNSDNYAIRKS
jgi:hypothetical protein